MKRRITSRSGANYNRKGPERQPYDTVLIVCEGSKTEPNYLDGLRIRYRLSSANIRIVHPQATNPLSIVEVAEDGLRRGEFDRAFCVFDRDGHTDFDAALTRIRTVHSSYGGRLSAIVSIPCFELWVLLHYEYTTSAFTAVGRRSSCDNVIARLRRHVPNYDKGRKDFVPELLDKIDDALRRSHRLAESNHKTGSANPTTMMHELIDYLKSLSN